MTPNDDAILRRIVIEELSEARARELAKFLITYRKNLIRRLDRLKDRSGMKARTLKAMLEASNSMHNQLYSNLRKKYRKGSRDFAADQAEWRAANVSSSIEATAVSLSTRQAIAAMDFNPAIGRHASEWFNELSRNHKKRVAAALRQSYTEGESISGTVRRIRDVMDYNARGLRTFVRTSYSNIAANVDLATYQANNIDKYVWLSTLDSRTTPICINRDGNEYVTGSGPLPPAHMNCRSTTYALTPETRGARKVTYNQWLRSQKAEVQDQVMGVARAKAYRADDSIEISKFISRNGGWKTLDELKL